mgnify:CR=1 FL=1
MTASALKNADIGFFFISQLILPPVVLAGAGWALPARDVRGYADLPARLVVVGGDGSLTLFVALAAVGVVLADV